MNTDQVIRLARKHVADSPSTEQSARRCLEDAIHAHDAGQLDAARRWAMRSLLFSVGVFSPAYRRARGE